MKAVSRRGAAAGAVICFFLLAGLGVAAGVGDLIARADRLYEERADLAKAEKAAELYRQAMAAAPDQAEPAWKLARAMYWLGDNAETNEEKMALHDQGIQAAKKAVERNPDSAAAHYWLGVNYGLYGQAKGILKSLSLRDPIKEEMNAVIKLDPGHEGGGAYRVLGRMYFKLPGLFGGDDDKAVELLKTAIKHGPRRWLNHVYLAEVYLKQRKLDQAEALVKQALAGPPEPAQAPEDESVKKDAQVLLEKIKKRRADQEKLGY